jgi:sterol desaturase/sphingolipid hydroxylase (fatty acid hydroxylase superfamily)
MKQLLHKFWNSEFGEVKPTYLGLIGGAILLIALVYVSGEVLFGLHPESAPFNLTHVWTFFTKGGDLPSGSTSLKPWFPQLWVGLALLCVIIRITVIIASYIQSKKVLGEQAFAHYFVTYFSSFVIATIASFTLLFGIAGIFYAAGYPLADSNIARNAFLAIEAWTNEHIPSLFNVHSYWLALGITFSVAALPNYAVHWLCHQSRLVWYVFHRCHHAPEFLHPLAAPPAYAFDFLLALPFGLVALIVSKLIYTEPLVMELSLYYLLGYWLEIFNHSIVHYRFARKNFIVRQLSHFYGDRGVYHLMHHSAKDGDQVINIGGGPFMMWDRLFGTYRAPYTEAPPLGLTNTPPISHNPMRIIFSGIVQIWYELRMNKSWRIRFKIIFGSIYYKPPITKEFLILDGTQ